MIGNKDIDKITDAVMEKRSEKLKGGKAGMEMEDLQNADPIIITITSTEKTAGEDEVEYVLTTEGTYREKNGKVYLGYEETELTDGKSKVMLIVDKDTLKMRRYGDNSTNLMFKKGERYSSVYKTPYMSLRVEVLTDKVDIVLAGDKGEIDVAYTISIGGQEIHHGLNVRY